MEKQVFSPSPFFFDLPRGLLGAVWSRYACISPKDEMFPPSLKYTQRVWKQRDQFPLLICPTWDEICGSQGTSYLHAYQFDWQLWQKWGKYDARKNALEI